MVKLDLETFRVKTYVRDMLEKIDSRFYYRIKKLDEKFPFYTILIGNKNLEEKNPFIFPEERFIFVSSLFITSDKVGAKQRFYLGAGAEDEEEEWKKKVKITKIESIMELSKEVTRILSPGEKIEIIDTREKIGQYSLPYVMHYFNGYNYNFTEIRLKASIDDKLSSLQLGINLEIFYEFFKDLK